MGSLAASYSFNPSSRRFPMRNFAASADDSGRGLLDEQNPESCPVESTSDEDEEACDVEEWLLLGSTGSVSMIEGLSLQQSAPFGQVNALSLVLSSLRRALSISRSHWQSSTSSGVVSGVCVSLSGIFSCAGRGFANVLRASKIGL